MAGAPFCDPLNPLGKDNFWEAPAAAGADCPPVRRGRTAPPFSPGETPETAARETRRPPCRGGAGPAPPLRGHIAAKICPAEKRVQSSAGSAKKETRRARGPRKPALPGSGNAGEKPAVNQECATIPRSRKICPKRGRQQAGGRHALVGPQNGLRLRLLFDHCTGAERKRRDASVPPLRLISSAARTPGPCSRRGPPAAARR
jgi:hypothetical protein